MSYSALVLVVFSALMHSTYNFAYKRSKLKAVYLWGMFSVAVSLMTTAALFRANFILTDFKTITLAAVAAAFFSMYQIYTGKAYALAGGDLSIVYPLSITAPLYIPFLAYFIIGERVSVTTFFGIILALFGTYLIQLNVPLKRISFKKVDFTKRHIRYALFAGFIYSFGAIVDKIGVGKNNFFIYTYWVVVIMFVYMTLNILKNKELRHSILYCHKRNFYGVLFGGVVMSLSFLSYRCAMQLTQVSAVAGARQISSLFGVFMGIFLLKEPYGALRFFASVLIVVGVILIKIG